MAEVNARKRGTKWQYYFEAAKVDGKRQRICKSGFTTKKEALEAGVKALSEYNNGGVALLDDKISVYDFSEVYLEHCRSMLKYTTYISYEGTINTYLNKDYGKYKITKFNKDTAEKYLISLKDSGLSRGTIRKIINISKQMFKFAVRKNVISSNPFEDLKIPDNIENLGNPNYAYSDDVITEYYSLYKNDILGIVFMLGYHCGLRLSESLAVTWNDIDFENKTLSITKQLQYRNGIFYFTLPKYGSIRTITIDDKIIEYLKNLKTERSNYPCLKKYRLNLDKSISLASESDDWFCFVVSKLDGSLVSNKYIHRKLDSFRYQGYKTFRTHNLRHTHCTKLIENDVDIKYVQERMGHKDVQTTMNIYNHIRDDKKIRESNKINDIFS